MSNQKTIGELTHEKKMLLKQMKSNPALAESLTHQVDELDKKIMAKVNRKDKNFLNVFYKTAKEGLPVEVFDRLNDISSTRRNDHIKQA